MKIKNNFGGLKQKAWKESLKTLEAVLELAFYLTNNLLTDLYLFIFFQALEGFLLVLTEDMKVLFVTESVRDYLGYCQVIFSISNSYSYLTTVNHLN